MTRRFSSSFLLVVGLVCTTIAASGWALQATITSRSRVLGEADQIAKSEPVREEFAWKIADVLAPHSAALSSPQDLNHANDVARRAVETPEFAQAFVYALPALYDRVVNGQPADIALDANLVNTAIVKGGGIPPAGYVLRVAASDLPDFRRGLDMVRRASMFLGAFGILLIAGAVIWSEHRSRAVMRIGRWLITIGLLTILMFWLLPMVAFLPLGGWFGVLGIVLATGDWMAVPAALMTALGITILIMGRASEAEARRRALAVIPTATRTPTRAHG
jgi:hypothetical protein